MSEEPFEQYVARQLSVSQWEFLAEHFEGGRRMIRTRVSSWNEERTRGAMLSRKLVVLYPPNSPRPTHTVLTQTGHAVMCAALGMMADMLTVNGFELREPPGTPTHTRRGYGIIARDEQWP